MNIQEHISLKPYTTFMTESSARYFFELTSVNQIKGLVNSSYWNYNPYIIGGGSNLLFTKDYDGLVVLNKLKGVTITKETNTHVEVNFAAGESWHESVLWAAENGFWGIENLVLIPGTVGAAPVQNIGAYGVEAANTISSVEVFNVVEKEIEILLNSECNFGYRDSIFKQNPDTYIVLSVTFMLQKNPNPQLGYGAIINELVERKIKNPTLKQITDVITFIRRSKLPDVGSVGMAGSFFKNPVITKEHFEEILEKYPDAPSYKTDESFVKIPAGWIIEILGYKGVKKGNVGTYEKHALVLVNHGNATGQEVWVFAEEIIDQVKEDFGIIFEPEVIVL